MILLAIQPVHVDQNTSAVQQYSCCTKIGVANTCDLDNYHHNILRSRRPMVKQYVPFYSCKTILCILLKFFSESLSLKRTNICSRLSQYRDLAIVILIHTIQTIIYRESHRMLTKRRLSAFSIDY